MTSFIFWTLIILVIAATIDAARAYTVEDVLYEQPMMDFWQKAGAPQIRIHAPGELKIICQDWTAMGCLNQQTEVLHLGYNYTSKDVLLDLMYHEIYHVFTIDEERTRRVAAYYVKEHKKWLNNDNARML